MVAMFTLVLAACGQSDKTGGASGGDAAAGDSPAATEKLTIEHKLGKADITKNPSRVVVFDFGILDSLDKLGVDVLGVPQANILEIAMTLLEKRPCIIPIIQCVTDYAFAK